MCCPGEAGQVETWHPPFYPFCTGHCLDWSSPPPSSVSLPAPLWPLWPDLAPPWQCSATCGEGIQQRQVVCRTNANSLGQCEGDKPDTVQVCSLPACGGESDRIVGRENRQARIFWSRHETQPGLHSGSLEIPYTRAAFPCS